MTTPTRAAMVKARIAPVLLGLGVLATTLGLSTQAQACNARGEFCGQPTWAANAFSGPYNRVPEASSGNRHYQAARPVKPVITEKVIAVKKVPPMFRFSDGLGRQFDSASNVWFDGNGQCWSGRKPFTFKGGDWFYGAKEWAEDNGVWEVESGGSPELVSCESVPSFAAKAAAIAAKAATQKAENPDKGATRQPAPATPGPAKIKTAEGDPSVAAQKPVTPASAECRKYFASIGQMLTVPCGE